MKMIYFVLHAVLEQAVKEGILDRALADSANRPKMEVVECQILTKEQAQCLIIATSSTSFGTHIYIALMTGTREGELLSLKWSEVDWNKGQLHVQRKLQVKEIDGSVMVPPKTRGHPPDQGGTRNPEQAGKTRRAVNLKKTYPHWQKNGLFFPNTIEKPESSKKIFYDYKLLLRKNGLQDINLRVLKHTLLSLLLDMGTPINNVQKRA